MDESLDKDCIENVDETHFVIIMYDSLTISSIYSRREVRGCFFWRVGYEIGQTYHRGCQCHRRTFLYDI